MAAYTGPPGVGKTHGLAHAVEVRLDAELPALLLRARDCPVAEGWVGILRQKLDRPAAPLEELLNALEATAVRADVRRARQAVAQGASAEGVVEIDRERTCFLLAIDGLEEAGEHERWAERLGELSAHLQDHGRLRAAVTLRTASREPILGRVRCDRFDEVTLSEDEDDVQRLLPRYCEHYRVAPPDHRLRWALREPLSLRLYCELLKEGHPEVGTSRRSLTLPYLLSKKLDHVEDALRDEGGWSRDEAPPASDSQGDGRGLCAARSIAARGGRALTLVDAKPSHSGAEWCFLDRQGAVQAVYSPSRAASCEHQEVLVIRKSSLESALAMRGLSLFWGGWLHREPHPSLADWHREERPFVHWDWRWLGFMTSDEPRIIDPPPGR